MDLPEIKLPQDYLPQPDALKERVILVTGAGQGVGKMTAIECARHGATVVLHGRNVQKLEAVYDEIESAGLPQPAIFPLDYANATQASLDGLAQSIHGTLKRLDGIFHNATYFSSTMPMDLHDLDMWTRHLTVNLTVPAALTKACMPMLKKSPDASVVFLTETHALEPKAYWGAFAVSKSALSALTRIGRMNMKTIPGSVSIFASPVRLRPQ